MGVYGCSDGMYGRCNGVWVCMGVVVCVWVYGGVVMGCMIVRGRNDGVY